MSRSAGPRADTVRRGPEPPAPPRLGDTLTELPRAGMEAARLALALRSIVSGAPRGDGHTVVTLPGYGGGDGSMALARVFLRRLGYEARGLGLGVNLEPRDRRILSVDDALAFRDRMATRVARRLREITDELGEPVSLLGWSMGGLYALDAARAEPGCVRRVVTLGSPFGDPRGTSLFSLLRRINRSDVPIESQDFAGWLARSTSGDVRVPIAILYSPRDGIVAPDVARLPEHPAIECIAVDSSHVGFAVNPDALRRVAELLAR